MIRIPWHLITATLAVIGTLTLATCVAHAASICAPTEALIASAKTQSGEVPAFHGSLRDGSVFMVLIDPADQSWTALIRMGSGMACVVGSGDDFESETVTPGEPS